MKQSKKEVEEAILYFGEKYDKLDAYKALLNDKCSLPSLSRMIIMELFLREFAFTNKDKFDCLHYRVILDYSKELEKIGFVEFGEE